MYITYKNLHCYFASNIFRWKHILHAGMCYRQIMFSEIPSLLISIRHGYGGQPLLLRI